MDSDGFSYWVSAADEPIQSANGDWQIGRLKFPRAANPDGIAPTIITSQEDGGKAIRLAVRAGSYRSPNEADNANDRCELRELDNDPPR
jgi:hypothetical protein